MDAVRVFVSLTADHLSYTPAARPAEQVHAAVHDRALGRLLLRLTEKQMESVAYGLWWHRMTRSAEEANRFGREYGIFHQHARGVGVSDPAQSTTFSGDVSTFSGGGVLTIALPA